MKQTNINGLKEHILDFDLYPQPGAWIQVSEAVELKPAMHGTCCLNMSDFQVIRIGNKNRIICFKFGLDCDITERWRCIFTAPY